MSSVEPSTGGTVPRPPEPADVAVDGHQIPADPLLQPGTFIDATEPTLTEQQPAQNEVSGARESSDEPDEQAPPVADPSAVDSADSTPSKLKGTPKASGAVDSTPERPDWLPEGWRMDCKIRTSGATAGSMDRYYVELESGRRFRSRKEVEYYREHGTIRKKKKGAEAAAAGAADVNSPADQETKPKPPPKKKAKKTVAPANFDYKDVPDMVQWRLTDASGDTWTPYVGGDKVVSATTKKEWDSAFRFSCGL